MALDWHRWMLGYAHHGLGKRRFFASCLTNSCLYTVKTDSTHYVPANREGLFVTEPTIHLTPMSKTAHSACETVYLALWLEMYNIPNNLIQVSNK